jgi:hypothetical protein
MLQWMLNLLIRLAPDQDDMSEEAKRVVYENTPDVESLEQTAHDLIGNLETLNKTIVQ